MRSPLHLRARSLGGLLRPHGRGGSAFVAGAVGASLLVGAAAPAAGADGPVGPDSTHAVVGVLERVIVEEAHPEEAVGPEGEASPLEIVSIVEVDGSLYPLPEELQVAGTTGDEIEVTIEAEAGMSLDEALAEVAVVEADDTATIVGVAPAQGEPSAATDEELMQVTLGAHSLTVLPVYWSSKDGATVSSLTNVATSTAQYWTAQSGGRLSVQASVRDWRAIPDPGSCNSTSIFDSAMAAHGNPPVSATQHVLIYFPHRSDCGGWAGMATIGGGKIWVNGTQLPDVFSHELGHNLGLGHANTMTCFQGGVRQPLALPVSTSCTQQGYGDTADVMGVGQYLPTGNLNTAFADVLGFASVTQFTSAPAAATPVTLAPLASFTSMRSVKVPTADGTVFIDYRPAVAPDVRKTAWSGVQAHLLRVEGGVPSTYILDLQPALAPFQAANLPVGGTWDIPGTNTRVRVNGTGPTATLSVSSTQAPPVAPVPMVGDLRFVPVAPARLLDTRTAQDPLAQMVRRDVQVTGRAGIPSNAKAVALNVTTVGSTTSTYVRVWPAGQPEPATSAMNTDASRTTGAGIMVGIGGEGKVSLLNNRGSTHAVVDVTGYYTDAVGQGSRYEQLATGTRVLDTRRSGGAMTDRQQRTVQVGGIGEIPSDASAVAVNITSVSSVGQGNIAAFPSGGPVPATSNVNHLPGQDVTNRTIVPLADGRMDLRLSGGTANVVVDVVGWFGPGASLQFTPLAPVRGFDSRTGGRPLSQAETRSFDLSAASGLPADAKVAAMTLTATQQTAFATFLTVWEAGAARPATSDLNTGSGRDQANLSFSTIGSRHVQVYNNGGATHVIGDIFGYFR